MNVLSTAILALSAAVSPMWAVDAGLLQYAASDATEIAGVNVDRAAGFSLTAELVKRVGSGDVHEVMLVSRRGVGLIAARGVFDPALVAGKLVESYNGVDLYAARRGNGLVAFPEATVALYGDAKTVKAALDRRGTATALDPVLGAKVSDLGSRYDAWFAAKSSPGLRIGKTKLPAEALELVSGGLTLGSVVRLDAEAVMKTEKDALALVQLIKFLAVMIDGRNGQVKQLLQNADARAEGAKVVFSTSANEADLEQMLGIRKKTAALGQ